MCKPFKSESAAHVSPHTRLSQRKHDKRTDRVEVRWRAAALDDFVVGRDELAALWEDRNDLADRQLVARAIAAVTEVHKHAAPAFVQVGAQSTGRALELS